MKALLIIVIIGLSFMFGVFESRVGVNTKLNKIIDWSSVPSRGQVYVTIQVLVKDGQVKLWPLRQGIQSANTLLEAK